MKRIILPLFMAFASTAYASTWEYDRDYDDITQEYSNMAIAESDSAKDLSGNNIRDAAQIAFYHSNNMRLAMVLIDEGSFDICMNGCLMPIRIDDTSYYANLQGDGGEAEVILSIYEKDTMERYNGYDFLAEHLPKAKTVAFRVSRFIGDDANYYFKFTKPLDLKKIEIED